MSKKRKRDVEENGIGLPGLGLGGFDYAPSKATQTEEVVEQKKGKFKRSGDLTDQLLKYRYPKDNQPSLFDTLLPETVKKIEVSGTEIREVVEGIRLTGAEQKVVDSLTKLLHNNSQNVDPEKDDYYTGNAEKSVVLFGSPPANVKTAAPNLAITLYQLTQEYKGGEYVSGKDITNVRNILTALSEKKFLFSYTETTMIKGGKEKLEQKIEDFLPLIKLPTYTRRILDAETNTELSKTSEILIGLNPIFHRQIAGRGILYPEDINKRTIIAYGSHNVSESTFRLRDWLIRKLSFKKTQQKPQEINLERLFYLLDEKKMNESRRKLVEKNTKKAIEACIKLGLLEKYEIVKGNTGEPKVVFYLNKDWE